MNLIDAHVHFWNVKNGYNEWVKNTSLPHLVTPDHLDASDFVHIEAHDEKNDSLCEYFWLKHQFSNINIKVVVFVDFNLEISKFVEKIKYISQYEDIVGVRQIMAKTNKSKYSPFKKDIPKDLEQKLKVLAEHKLVFEAQMYPEQFLHILEEINNSNVIMAIEHFGLPIFDNNANLAEWCTLINEVSQNKNWIFKLSGFDLNNTMSNIEKALDYVFENITINQLCYGSNFPVSNCTNYNAWKNFLYTYINNEELSQYVFKIVSLQTYFKGA
ncbi:MAG: amidohydrolase family protein [Francisella sp.]